jgi:hypothetical protein
MKKACEWTKTAHARPKHVPSHEAISSGVPNHVTLQQSLDVFLNRRPPSICLEGGAAARKSGRRQIPAFPHVLGNVLHACPGCLTAR